MSISEQVNMLRTVAKSHKPYIPSIIYMGLIEAADTIEALFAKLENMKRPANLHIWDGVTDTTQRRLREKYKQKKPTKCEEYGDYSIGVCPYCIRLVHDIYNYCHHCGQHLDWNNMERPEDFGGWILCKDRLPEEGINPITKDFYEYQVTFKSKDVTDIRYYKFGRGHWLNGPGYMDDYVVAWKERPEPYHEP